MTTLRAVTMLAACHHRLGHRDQAIAWAERDFHLQTALQARVCGAEQGRPRDTVENKGGMGWGGGGREWRGSR